MLRPSARLPVRSLVRRAAAAPALAAMLALAHTPLAAQQTFSLPPASPSPTPAPAGPADERAGVAIPPRAAASAAPTAAPSPQVRPMAIPSAATTPQRAPAPRESAPPARAGAPSANLTPPAAAPAPLPGLDATGPEATQVPQAPQASAPAASGAAPPLASAPADAGGAAGAPALSGWPLPAWWPLAAGALGALIVLAGVALLVRRRRKARPLRLAAPGAGVPAAGAPPADSTPPRLDLTLEITAASRSLMMFTLEYRLTIANRSERAVGDLHTALQLACARASSAPSPGAAQALAAISRIGPHQARSLTGTVQLPLSAIAPLRQGKTPLFVPLVHVTLEGESLPALVRTFVIGTPSQSGRVHPIALDVPPGGIAGLVAQAVALPPASAPASAAA